MQTSAAGNRKRQSAGFTLLELLVVLAIVALASAGVGFALRDSSMVQLERDAERLASGLGVCFHGNFAKITVKEGVPMLFKLSVVAHGPLNL